MNKVCVVVKCNPSGDRYVGQETEVNYEMMAIRLLKIAMLDHDTFESYSIEVNPVTETGKVKKL